MILVNFFFFHLSLIYLFTYFELDVFKNNFSLNNFLAVEFNEESNESLLTPNDTGEPESPSLSPTSTVSGPYIPISECISGKPLNTPVG